MFSELDRLLSLKNRKILFVGIGNLLKKDDGVGVYISKKIKNRGSVSSLTAETSIENYIGKINSMNPDTLIIVDCMDFRSRPGTFKLLEMSQIIDFTFNTHNISLNKISEFFHMPSYMLGIQPGNVEFGENISYLVKEIADKIIKQINRQEV